MNGIFSLFFLFSAILFLATDPDGFLPALLSGAEKATTLTLSLLAVYCVWLAFFEMLEKSGASKKLALATFPLCSRLFRTQDREAIALTSANLSANLLGLPGAPTPLGVRATEKFCAAKNEYAADMLFVLNATSLQLLPTTVIALRASFGASSPADIFLPTLLATLFSSVLGVLLLRLFRRRT